MEITKGRFEKEDSVYELLDTPALSGTYICSREEVIARDAILNEKPDILVQCADANQLKQSLSLTLDLMELGIPMVLCLNAIDETAKRGIWIDSRRLSDMLGIPVVESVATKEIGTQELKEAIHKAGPARGLMTYDAMTEENISTLMLKLPADMEFRRKIAMLLLQKDEYISGFIEKKYGQNIARDISSTAELLRKNCEGSFSRILSLTVKRRVEEISRAVMHKQKILLEEHSQRFSQLCRDPFWGLFILSGVVWMMYILVVDVANTVSNWMNQYLWFPVSNQIDIHVHSLFWKEFLIGDYGILSMGLANAVMTVLPILSFFFLFFNILEDTGYIPSICILTKRVFEKFGLSGQAIMPIALGFGCKTMATMNTCCLRSPKERYITAYLIAFAIPCAAQMGLNLSILGRCGVKAFLIAYITLGVAQVLAGLCLNKVLKDDQKSDFIQEVPRMRMPDPKLVLVKVYYRLYWFLKEAVPVFMITAVILFASDKVGLLGLIKQITSPVVKNFLGLPLQMVDVLIVCVARREAAAGMIIKLVQNGTLSVTQCIVAVVLTTTFLPCLAHTVALAREIGTRKAAEMMAIINVSSILLSGGLYWALVFFQK
jgi:ferrous iron transport protein B